MKINPIITQLIRFGWQWAFVRELKILGNEMTPEADFDLVFEGLRYKPTGRPYADYLIDLPVDRWWDVLRGARLGICCTDLVRERTELKMDLEDVHVPLEVVYHGVDDRIAEKFEPKEGEYFLHVGEFDPRKRVPELARIMREIGCPMVFVGGGVEEGKVRAANPSARFLGRVGEGEKFKWIAGCKALVTWSPAEGFFIPACEAGFFSKPVVARDLPALRELYEDSLLSYTDENQFRGLILKIDRVKHRGKRLKNLIERKKLLVTEQAKRLDAILREWFGSKNGKNPLG